MVRGRPLDPLIAAWEAHRWEARRGGHSQGREPLAALALRLGAMPTAPGTAGLLARCLLADYEMTRAFGPGWIRQADLMPGNGPKARAGQARRTVGATPGMTRPGQAPPWRQPGPAWSQRHVRRPGPDSGHGPVRA